MGAICIICAIPQETGHLLTKFPQRTCGAFAGFRSWETTAAGKNITVIESGIGRENATRAITAVILRNRPDCVISSGFCGALTAGLQVGDIVTANVIHNLSNGLPGQPIKVDASLNDSALKGLTIADFISTDSICDKKELVQTVACSSTAVVDMESFAIASMCKEYGIPFIAVRAVSDALDTDPGQLFRAIADQNFTIRLPAVISAVVGRPSFLSQLLTLAKSAKIAGKSLAAALFTIVERL